MRKHIILLLYRGGWATLCFGLTAVGALLLYQSIMAAPASVVQPPWLDIGLELAIISLISLSLLALLLPLSRVLRSTIILSLLSLFLLGIMTFVLKETVYPHGGLQGDQRFYATYLAKLATYAGYPDVMYRDLPTFYPPLYYYLLGQGARLLAVEPYQMLKFGLLLTAFGLPFLMAGLWRTLVGYRAALLITFALVVGPNWFKPAEWISEVLFVPWWLYWVMNITQHRPQNRWQRVGWYGIGGLIGGLLFQNYYYWFFIGGLSLVVSVVDGWRSPVEQSNQRFFNFTNILLMLASAALFSSNYWWPYLYSMYTTGGWTPLQNRWLTLGKIELPLPFLEFSFSGLVAMLGLITLWLGAYTSPLCRGLRNLFIAAYLWLLLGYLGILLDRPLLSFRAYPLIEHLLVIGALLGWAGVWFPTLAIWPQPFSERMRKTGQRIVPIVGISLLCFFVADTARDLKGDKQVTRAIEATPPETLLQEFDRLSGGNSKDKTLWADTAYNNLFAYRPLYTFLPWSAHFSHPAGLFHQRVDLLEKLATTHSPTLFAAALMNNRYDPIDYIMLKQSGGQYLFSYSEDNFPNRTQTRTFAYPPDLFSEAYFEHRYDNAYTLLLPKPEENPLSHSLFDEEIPSETLALWHSLRTTFGEHLALPTPLPSLVEIEQQLATADLAVLSRGTLLDLAQGAIGPFGEQVRAALITKLQTRSSNYQPMELVLMDQVGSHKLQILGYQVEPLSDAAFNLTLYFQVLSPLDHDYLVWFHAFQDGAKSNLDHAPIVPTTGWQLGKIYRDSYTIHQPINRSVVEFGFWNQEKDVRLVQTSWEMGVRLDNHH